MSCANLRCFDVNCVADLCPRVFFLTPRPSICRWNYSEFSTCMSPCGIGIQTRDVTCIHEVTHGTGKAVPVPNYMCPQPPPADRRYCNVWDCPVKWNVGEWGKVYICRCWCKDLIIPEAAVRCTRETALRAERYELSHLINNNPTNVSRCKKLPVPLKISRRREKSRYIPQITMHKG